MVILIVFIMKTLIIMIIFLMLMMINTEKLESLEDYLNCLIASDYHKPIITDVGHAGRNDNYIEYMSKGERYENLSLKEYLIVIRPYLRDLINDYKPTAELNNNNNNSNRAKWKIQLKMHVKCISTKGFIDKCTMHPISEPVETFMGSNTKDVIDKLFNTLLQRFQKSQETSNQRWRKFIPDSVELLYYYFQRIDIRRAESYIMSPDWIASKKATINPKNEKDNKCFQ